MLIPLVARLAGQAEREVERYAAWAAALRRFRDDWDAGRRAAPAEYLSGVPEDQRAEALQDLIAELLHRAWRAGPGPRVDADAPAELVEDEFLARHRPPHGDMPPLQEYERRFPSRPDAMQLLEARCLLGGRYVMLRRTGLGAVGEVWEACDRHLSRLVAIKTPRAELRRDERVLWSFREEARVTAGLEHPGIPVVHDLHVSADGVPFYVMCLIDGRTLAERIREGHADLLLSFVAVCDSVAHAHSRGVLHRDLKPGNILVGDSGETVVLDWGPAAEGTPEYMAPEQADRAPDARSDVFGLGAILYEILTGRAPHAWPEGLRPDDWRGLVRRAEIPPPRRCDRALAAICRKALSRDPSARHAGAAEVARDVRQVLSREPVLSRIWRGLTRAAAPGGELRGPTGEVPQAGRV